MAGRVILGSMRERLSIIIISDVKILQDAAGTAELDNDPSYILRLVWVVKLLGPDLVIFRGISHPISMSVLMSLG